MQGSNPVPNSNHADKISRSSIGALAISDEFREDLEVLDEKVKSMMEKGRNMIPAGKHANGTPKQAMAMICTVCGKEGLSKHITHHIETNHMDGISIPCAMCEKILPSRNALSQHKSKFHRSQA